VAADAPAPPPPADPGRQFAEALGPTFVVFRDSVQRDLGLSDEQRQKIQKRLAETSQDAGRFFQSLETKSADDRPKALHAYRERALETLTAFLQGLLRDEQLHRLRQVMLQQEGVFALGNPDIGKELGLTDDQRRQFAEVVRAMQREIEPLMRQAQESGKHEEARGEAMKARAAAAGRIEALLTDGQRERWKELLGKPLDLGD
jgi:hypothetical protein